MKRIMLINALRREELRVAVVADNRLENYLVDVADSGLRRGNIYRGVVASVQPQLNAAFVEFGEARHGFLSAQDVVPQAYHRSPPKGERRPRIDQVLERGRPLLVQVTKDAVAAKGAALTTNVSLAGRYLVFTPFDTMRGLSRKVEDEKLRKAMKEKAKGLRVPEGAGYIIRTNAVDQPKTALSRDLNALLRLWKRIQEESRKGHGPRLLYSDQDLVIQVLRDYLDSSITEVWVDAEPVLEQARAFVRTFMPRAKVQLRAYTDRMPLFSRFGLEPQIDAIFGRKVPLPGGGSIVIDPTEALTAIDVNSGKARGGSTQEENILQVNLEAAAEVARQLRLRDIGGLIVVDFIDMRSAKHRRAVEKALRDELKRDKARTAVTRISENGLLEINRQRLQQAIQLRTHRTCPTCDGLGLIASPEHVALGLIRRVEARAAEGTLAGVRISLHPELADHIQNHHRRELADLEEEFDLTIEVIAAGGLHRAEERIEWRRRERPVRPPRASQSAAASVTDLTDEELEPLEAVPASNPLEPDAVGAPATAPRKRRRRSRRRKSSAAVAATAPAEQTAAAHAEEATSGAAHPAAESPPSSPSAGKDAVPPTADTSNASEKANAANGASTKKRRRRSRRKRTPEPGAATARETAQSGAASDPPGPGPQPQPTPAKPSPPKGAPASPPETAASQAAGRARRKRRSAPRSSTRKSARAQDQPASQSAEAPAPEPKR